MPLGSITGVSRTTSAWRCRARRISALSTSLYGICLPPAMCAKRVSAAAASNDCRCPLRRTYYGGTSHHNHNSGAGGKE